LHFCFVKVVVVLIIGGGGSCVDLTNNDRMPVQRWLGHSAFPVPVSYLLFNNTD